MWSRSQCDSGPAVHSHEVDAATRRYARRSAVAGAGCGVRRFDRAGERARVRAVRAEYRGQPVDLDTHRGEIAGLKIAMCPEEDVDDRGERIADGVRAVGLSARRAKQQSQHSCPAYLRVTEPRQ
jgi:hypothetical protein